jgi:hypothetical protein
MPSGPASNGMVQDTYTGLWDEPSALERERAMGFMDHTTCAPSITEADRRRLLGSTMDMHCDDWAWLSLNRRSRQLFVTCGYERSGFS